MVATIGNFKIATIVQMITGGLCAIFSLLTGLAALGIKTLSDTKQCFTKTDVITRVAFGPGVFGILSCLSLLVMSSVFAQGYYFGTDAPVSNKVTEEAKEVVKKKNFN